MLGSIPLCSISVHTEYGLSKANAVSHCILKVWTMRISGLAQTPSCLGCLVLHHGRCHLDFFRLEQSAIYSDKGLCERCDGRLSAFFSGDRVARTVREGGGLTGLAGDAWAGVEDAGTASVCQLDLIKCGC